MSATRGESYAYMSVYVDVFISRLGLRERWLIPFALYFYPTIYPPTHQAPISKKKKEKKKKKSRNSISLDVSQLYSVVIISPHLSPPKQKTYFNQRAV